jgi:hypothetical protein
MSKDKSYSLDHIIPAGNYAYFSGKDICMPTMIQSLLSSKGDKFIQQVSGHGILTNSLDELLLVIQNNGGKKIIHNDSCGSGIYTFIWEDSFMDIIFDSKNKSINMNGYFLDPKLVKMFSILKDNFISTSKTNLVFVIIQNKDELEIRNMGNGSSPLIADNYLPETLHGIDFVIKSFQKDPPGGRICILNGEPGTGKTHLIRSILSQLDCVFLIVPSNLVESLDKPNFVPLLIQTKKDWDKPIILVIEDGDTCLVPRENDNISTITSVLNLSDGIMGAMLDIKMIISTNADIQNMDKAIMRPGRLCRNIYVGPLPYEQSNRIYQRLMKNENVQLECRRSYTLAEIYDQVNNIDTLQNNTYFNTNKRVVGFIQPQTYNQDQTLNVGSKIGFRG